MTSSTADSAAHAGPPPTTVQMVDALAWGSEAQIDPEAAAIFGNLDVRLDEGLITIDVISELGDRRILISPYELRWAMIAAGIDWVEIPEPELLEARGEIARLDERLPDLDTATGQGRR